MRKDYRTKKAFRDYIGQNMLNSPEADNYGIRLKLTWRKKSYILSGSSTTIRVYGKGWLDKKGIWHFGSAIGPKGFNSTAAMIKTVKGLK